ncbi:hypothetical protein B0H13DRAFT_2041561 [Mycena leptocephala]|nr:hypothetical protein B0H13DRAFT_2041561 [Mycena leptocephala]
MRTGIFGCVLEDGCGWSLAVAGAVSLGVCTLVCGGACRSSLVFYFFGTGLLDCDFVSFFPLLLGARCEV